MITIYKVMTEQGVKYVVANLFTNHIFLETYSELEATTAQRLIITGQVV